MATEQGGISKAHVVPNARVARVAALAFINNYYHVLVFSPELLYKFYRDCSSVSREGPNGLILTGTAVTKPQITFPYYSGFNVEIKTVDSQQSHNNGVLVVVAGTITFKNHETRSFTQTFFLAPQENGYFVQNDIFKFADEESHQPIQNLFYLNGEQYPITANPVSEAVVKSEIVAQAQSVVIEQPRTTIAEEPAHVVEKVEMKKTRDPEGSADQFSVFVSNLHANITPAQVEAEFKKFGAIKASGVEVRSTQAGGSSYAFIEFEEAASVEAAVHAAPIPMGGRQISVWKKRSFSDGEGFRNDNDGTRRRGGYSYGGRGNGRSDFVNRGGRGGSLPGHAPGQFSARYETEGNQIRNARTGTQPASGMVKRNGI